MEKDLFYNSIANNFDSLMNQYDVNRRLQVIFDDFLGDVNLEGKSLLDGGCGSGRFTEKAVSRGANVTAVDIADKLVSFTQLRVPSCKAVTASILDLPFEDGTFDIVISSDVIEHTPDPFHATKELIRVLKPNGIFCITVPNRTLWYFSLVLAKKLGMRPYQGHENWVHYNQFRSFLAQNEIEIQDYKGVHLYPFQLKPFHRALPYIDKHFGHTLGPAMINIAAFGKKN